MKHRLESINKGGEGQIRNRLRDSKCEKYQTNYVISFDTVHEVKGKVDNLFYLICYFIICYLYPMVYCTYFTYWRSIGVSQETEYDKIE